MRKLRRRKCGKENLSAPKRTCIRYSEKSKMIFAPASVSLCMSSKFLSPTNWVRAFKQMSLFNTKSVLKLDGNALSWLWKALRFFRTGHDPSCDSNHDKPIWLTQHKKKQRRFGATGIHPVEGVRGDATAGQQQGQMGSGLRRTAEARGHQSGIQHIVSERWWWFDRPTDRYYRTTIESVYDQVGLVFRRETNFRKQYVNVMLCVIFGFGVWSRYPICSSAH